ncbi:hypothetical protein [Streptococcus respiraculi]|uniref:hypothetical protein n=1 Tax=Streptococcus respiraculi TaxID=2021971 RepID=UPI000E761897|nr:hypothetical protein [Streptococcus respiraculi]
MFILKHGLKQDKPYLRNAEFKCTGIDLSYCEEPRKAMKFASRSVAILVSRALIAYGNFYPIEEEGLERT